MVFKLSVVGDVSRALPDTRIRSVTDWMLLGVGIGRVCRDDVTDPAERSAGSDPKTGRDYKPENACQNSTVVKLANSGNKKA